LFYGTVYGSLKEATVSVYNESYYSYFLRVSYRICVYQDLGAAAHSYRRVLKALQQFFWPIVLQFVVLARLAVDGVVWGVGPNFGASDTLVLLSIYSRVNTFCVFCLLFGNFFRYLLRLFPDARSQSCRGLRPETRPS
jgi:hypothetical protein